MIFDSCIWVALAPNQIDQQAVIEAARDAPVFTSVISLGELSFGVHACTDPAQRARRAAYLRQVESRPALGVSQHTVSAFWRALRCGQTGRSVTPAALQRPVDCRTAIEHGYTLLTLNSRDFEGLPGLRLVTLSPIAQG